MEKEFNKTKVEIKSTVSVTTIKSFSVQLDKNKLRELLRLSGTIIPESAEIFVRCPGGACWNNEALDIDSETPIQIEWTEKSETTEC